MTVMTAGSRTRGWRGSEIVGGSEIIAIAIAALIFAAYRLFRAARQAERSRELEERAGALGLDFRRGISVRPDLRSFDLTENEYRIETADTMRGKVDGVDVEVFDCPCHGSPHSGNPPKRVTVLKVQAPKGTDGEKVGRRAAARGLTAEIRSTGTTFFYRGGTEIESAGIDSFIGDGIAALRG